jgi:threonine/homoserine/homoserine lactone efflux protein
MFTNFPLFPQQASAQAGQVDAIYFFMVAVTAFFSILIATLVVVFAITATKWVRRSTGPWRSSCCGRSFRSSSSW